MGDRKEAEEVLSNAGKTLSADPRTREIPYLRESILRDIRKGTLTPDKRKAAQDAAEYGLGDPSVETSRSSERAWFDDVFIEPLSPEGLEAQITLKKAMEGLSAPPSVEVEAQKLREVLGLPDDVPDKKVLRIAKKLMAGKE